MRTVALSRLALRHALLSLPLLAAACAAPSSPSPAAPAGAAAAPGGFGRSELVDLFARWREGERRRDVAMAQGTLVFSCEEDREHHAAELRFLEDVPAGPICAPSELHLAGAPAGMGSGDYLFLEPVGGRYQGALVTVVPRPGGPRILYRRPDVTEAERRRLDAADLARTAAARRRAAWEALGGAALEGEVARLRRMLVLQTEATAWAAREGVAIAPYAPDPAALLAELEGLPPPAVRERVLAYLRPQGG